jgi:hypothetical protein
VVVLFSWVVLHVPINKHKVFLHYMNDSRNKAVLTSVH